MRQLLASYTLLEGGPSSQTRPWVAFRAAVHAAAARWCDAPVDDPDNDDLMRSCEECDACDAVWLITRGKA